MPIKILIVDDSDLIRTRLRGLFGGVAGIATISEATTLYEALDSVQFDPPTLVILDLNLPDGSGMHIIKPLKQSLPTLCIAVLTFHADASHRRHCQALGADWFFDKTTEIDHLLEVVRQLVGIHPLINPTKELP